MHLVQRMAVMSCRCVLANKSEADLFKLGECPLDPGGYFIVRVGQKDTADHLQLSAMLCLAPCMRRQTCSWQVLDSSLLIREGAVSVDTC